MTTRFIYPKTRASIELSVGKGENLDLLITKLKQKFNVPQINQLLICCKEMVDNRISGVMLRAPYKNELPEAYCYQIPSDKLEQYFRKIYVVDDSVDNPELQFLVFRDLTLRQVEGMYKFTKSSTPKSFSFTREDEQQILNIDTPIFMIPPEIRLKISPNAVRVVVHENEREIQKAKLDFSFFKKYNAKSLLLKLFPALNQNTINSKVFFKYYSVDIPENEIITPDPRDQIMIVIQHYVSPVRVTIKKQGSENTIEKILQKQDILYRTGQEIAQRCNFYMSEHSNFKLLNSNGNLIQTQYYKEGSSLTIIVEKQNMNFNNLDRKPSVQSINKFEALKKQLRQVFEKPDDLMQNKQIYDLLAVYMRSTFD